MRKLKYFLFIIFIIGINIEGKAQFTEEQLHKIDSLNSILNNDLSHDTSLAAAYVGLSEVLYIKSLDTITFLCLKAKAIAEKNLNTDLSTSEKESYLSSLSVALNNVGFVHKYKGNIDSALTYYRKSLKIAREIGDKVGLATGLNNIGIILQNRGDVKESLKYYLESLNIREQIGDKKEIAVSLNNIAHTFFIQGKIRKAFEYYDRCLKINESRKDDYAVAYTLNNIGIMYDDQGDQKKALEYYEKALSKQQEIGEKNHIISTLNNMGIIYLNQDNIKKGLTFFDKALNIAKEGENQNQVANSLHNIGLAYDMQGDKEEAMRFYQRSLDISRKVNEKRRIALTLHSIGNLYYEEGDIDKAKEYTEQSLSVAKEVAHPKSIRNATKVLWKIYKKDRNWHKALETYELFIEMRDSIQNEETQKTAIKREMQYEYDKKAQMDSIQGAEAQKVAEAQIAAQEVKLEQEETQRYALYGGLGLLLIFGGFMFNRFRVTNRQKGIIQRQKLKVEVKKQEAEHQKELVEEKNSEIMDSISYARRLQEAILPPKALVREWLPNSFILYKPKDIVAGDFYWMETIKGKIYFAAADCTGHGVPGAMVSVVCSNALTKALVEENITEPARILDRARQLVKEQFGRSEEEVRDGMDIALCSLNFQNPVKVENADRFKVKTTMEYAGANNPLWIIRKLSPEINEQLYSGESENSTESTHEVIEVKADKQPIGKYAGEKPFTNHLIELQEGDAIYIFSDGFADQFGGKKGKKFKAANFKKLLLSIQQEPMQNQRDLINKAFEEWKGDLEQVDDVCVIGVKV